MIHFSYYHAPTQETVEMQTDADDISTYELCDMLERFMLAIGYTLPENMGVQIAEKDV
jgi:TPP-dependent 2-oxoacid decarboxylase